MKNISHHTHASYRSSVTVISYHSHVSSENVRVFIASFVLPTSSTQFTCKPAANSRFFWLHSSASKVEKSRTFHKSIE